MATRMIRAHLLGLAAIFWLSGCACQTPAGRPFAFPADTFGFANELRWHYEFSDSGSVTTRQNEPPPAYSLRCFPLVRSAREFFYHAVFRPDLPQLARQDYRQLIKAVLARSSRCPSTPDDRVIIPGYRDLHEFSAAWGDLLKSQCGGATASFLQRGNWRMVFPLLKVNRRHTAKRLLEELNAGRVPIAHVYRFPNTTLNHALLIYRASETDFGVTFSAYDPNDPTRPALLTFDNASANFILDRTPYFPGGPVKVYEVYRGLFY